MKGIEYLGKEVKTRMDIYKSLCKKYELEPNLEFFEELIKTKSTEDIEDIFLRIL